jgi:hypothetical protein
VIPSVGAHHGVPFAEYLAWDAINWSTLKAFRQSAKAGHHAMCRPKDATEAMEFGDAFDCALLQPERFEKEYAVMPEFEGHYNSTIHKQQKQAWRDAHRGCAEVTGADHDRAKAMAREVMAHEVSGAIMRAKGRNQVSIVWKDKSTGELCKGRIDLICRIPAKLLDPNATGTILAMVDLKATAKFHSFDYQASDIGYHGQLAFYQDGLMTLDPTPVTPLIISVQNEKDSELDVAVRSCMDAVEHGRRLYRRLLNEFIRCRKTNNWPGIAPTGTIPLVVSPWAREPENEI